jgi:hypothetical protein
MYVFNAARDHLAIEGVIDVCLVPWAGGETGNPFDMLLVMCAGADRKQTPELWINEWYEKRRGRFFTKAEMERIPPAWGFKNHWHTHRVAGGGSLLMARVFRGLPNRKQPGFGATTGIAAGGRLIRFRGGRSA